MERECIKGYEERQQVKPVILKQNVNGYEISVILNQKRGSMFAITMWGSSAINFSERYANSIEQLIEHIRYYIELAKKNLKGELKPLNSYPILINQL